MEKQPLIRRASHKYIHISSDIFEDTIFRILPFCLFIEHEEAAPFFLPESGQLSQVNTLLRIREGVMPAFKQPGHPSWTHLELNSRASKSFVPHQYISNHTVSVFSLKYISKVPTPR